ncbi:MAG: helix-turn-helix domain-containing protein [Chitinophagaceae bacterium]
MDQAGILTKEECTKSLLPIKDALEVINGKWKLHIIGSLLHGEKRFKDLQRDIAGITAKMLSQELKALEMHELISRTVYDSSPVVVEYALTEYGHTLKRLMDELRVWGNNHRKRIMKKSDAV